jgi:hypothetical protein
MQQQDQLGLRRADTRRCMDSFSRTKGFQILFCQFYFENTYKRLKKNPFFWTDFSEALAKGENENRLFIQNSIFEISRKFKSKMDKHKF